MAEDILYLDFSSNSEINEEFNYDKIYKVGLREQFEKLGFHEDYDSFVSHVLPQDESIVGISYPNFERHPPTEDGKNKWFNIAVRIPLDGSKNNLVLMCDLDEYTPKNKTIKQRSLKVKGFTLIDKSTETCGEIEVSCRIFARLDFNDGWYSEYDGPTKFPSDDQWNKSVLTIEFLKRLNEQYVAEPHAKVLSRLDRWQKYLDSRQEIMIKDQEICFESAEGTEVIIAYYKDGCTEEERKTAVAHLNVKGNSSIWSTEDLSGSEKAPILHFTHDFLKKDPESDKSYRKKFERFTSGRSLIFSGKIEYKTIERKDGSKEKIPAFPSEIKIQDSRISSKVGEEEIPNTAKIDSLMKQYDQRIRESVDEVEKQKKAEIETLVDSFVKNRLKTLESEYRAEVRGDFLPECQKELDSLIEVKRKDISKEIADAEERTSADAEELAAVRKRKSDLIAELEELTSFVKKGTAKLLAAKSAEERSKLSKEIADKKKEVTDKTREKNNLEQKIVALIQSIPENNKVLETLRSKYEKIPEQFSLDEMLEKAMASTLAKFRKDRTEEYLNECRQNLYSKYEQLKSATQADLTVKRDKEIQDVLDNETHIRLHVFFRLDVDSSYESGSILQNVKEKMSDRKMYLYMDYSGDRAVIGRHNQALYFLKKGYVLNPFLATALFNKSTQKCIEELPIDKFFSPRLNDRQKQAVRRAVSSNGLFLIRGPPGTGKTEVIAEITAQLITQGKKVLIASENHKAVDNAFDRLPEIPSLRAVRIFGGFAAKKGEKNKFATSKLTRNFYQDIAKCLDDEIRKSSASTEYAAKLDSLIEGFRKRCKDLEDLKAKADSVLTEIEDKESKITRVNKKLARDIDDNSEYESQIFELKEAIKSIENGEQEAFETYCKDLSVKLNGTKLSVDAIRALYLFKKTDINKEFLVISEHPEFFVLFKDRASATDESTRNSIGVKILEYQKEHGINAYETRLLKIFPEGIPDKETVLDLKEKVEDKVDLAIEDLEKKIKGCRAVCSDTSRKEQELRSLEKELQELRNDNALIEYENASQELDSDIRKVLSDNNIIGVFKTPEEGIGFIETEKGRIKKAASSGLSLELRESYKKMADYLKDESVIEKDEESLNETLLYYANVIGLTCTTKDNIKTDAGVVDLKRANLDVVIVDEVSKVSFLEVLYPILYGKTVILVGDDKQLPPTYQSSVDKDDMSRYDSDLVNPDLEKEFQHLFETSFFKELYDSVPECHKTMLTTQYRMHPDIMEADNIFYDGQLTYGGAEGNREHYLEIKGVQKKIITPKNHLVFIDVEGDEIRGYSGGTSVINYREAEVIISLLKKMEYGCHKDANGQELGGRTFTKDDDPRLSLGVICGYSDQAKIIRNKIRNVKFQAFNRKDEEQFMVDTVDNFQGDERDIIILSLVRSNPSKSFMTKFNRINVAVSRARCLLVIVGNAKAFSSLRIELDGKEDFVYSKIVETAKRSHGYFAAKDIIGE